MVQHGAMSLSHGVLDQRLEWQCGVLQLVPWSSCPSWLRVKRCRSGSGRRCPSAPSDPRLAFFALVVAFGVKRAGLNYAVCFVAFLLLIATLGSHGVSLVTAPTVRCSVRPWSLRSWSGGSDRPRPGLVVSVGRCAPSLVQVSQSSKPRVGRSFRPSAAHSGSCLLT